MTRITVIQMDCSIDQRARADELVAAAARAGADFAVLPEMAGCAWLPAREDPAQLSLAEPADGPTVRAFGEIASRHRINLIVPLFELDGGNRFGTAFIMDRTGRLLGRYRKNHIPYEPGWYERYYITRGDGGYPVFEHEGLRFGIQICWDNMFVEGTRILALEGADVIFAPRATGVRSLRRWRSVLMANAAVNHVYIATANRVGLEQGIRFGGESLIADPNGDVAAAVQPADQPGVTLWEVSADDLAEARRSEPYFENRRPQLYSRLVENPDPRPDP